jgi:hypothetical protein
LFITVEVIDAEGRDQAIGSPKAQVSGESQAKSLPVQTVDATLAWSLSAGVWNPKAF